jgi:DNA repair exonuclease SbcCD ATPase subunit
MSKCNVCGKEMRAGTEHVRPDLATVCSSCAKRPFDYQQWRTASVVTPKMLDSCLDRIAELEARLNTMSQSYVDTLKRAEQAEARCKELAEETADRIGALLKAEAALAEMKARRCWTCRSHVFLLHGGNAYSTMKTHACPMFGREFEADGFCHRWTARAEEGSAK